MNEPSRLIEVRAGWINVYLEPKELDLVSFDYLLAKFYREVIMDGAIQRPLAVVLNPEIEGKRLYNHVDVWLLIYRARYRIQIRRTNSASISGPHAVRLYYQSWQNGEVYWLATAQIVDTMFYQETELVGNLNLLIADRAFYHTPATAKQFAAK